MKRRVCSLVITHSCNLNCVYCYEKFKSKQKMSFDIAVSVILKEVNFVKMTEEYGSLQIDFMGGEPFLEFSLIKEIVEWVKSQDISIPVSFFATTNGTLLTDVMKEWLTENNDIFHLGLSFDGSPLMQDINRSSSAKNIDMEFFRKNYPNQWVKMTVSPLSVCSFSKGLFWLYDQGFIVEANSAYGVEWSEQLLLEYKQQLQLIAEYYLKNPSSFIITPLKNIFKSVFGNTQNLINCTSGEDLITYDVDGCAYPCQYFTPLVLGNDSGKTIMESFYADKNKLDSNCKNCSMASVCKSCFGLNFKVNGSIVKREATLCAINRIQFEVAAWMYMEQLKLKKASNKIWSEEDYATAKGIVYYLKNLPNVLK